MTYLSARAHIYFTKGDPERGANMMREALAIIDSPAAGAAVPVTRQMEVLRSLVFDAARDRDENKLGNLIRRYAELAARHALAVPNTPVRTVAQRWPPGAHLSGSVDLEFDVLPDGRVENPRVIGGNLGAPYRKVARECVVQWRFLPAVEDGTAVRSMRQWRLSFNAH